MTNLKNRNPNLTLSVLSVDDDVDWQVAMTSYFNGTDVSFATAADGKDALKLLSLHKFDIVFMDLKMPQVDGFEATEILRSMGYKNAIVAVSADVIPGVHDQCLSLGFTDHLSKPASKAEVLSMIHKYAEIQIPRDLLGELDSKSSK